jgi:hypothetical protein
MKKVGKFCSVPATTPESSFYDPGSPNLLGGSKSDSFELDFNLDDIHITETPIAKVNQSGFKLDLSRVMRDLDQGEIYM